MKFGELTQIALLGTERQALATPGEGTPLGRLQAQLDPNRRERALLSLAALTGLHERTGRLPMRDIAPLPAPCTAEAQSRLHVIAASILSRMLSGEFEELLPEFLGLAAAAGKLATPETLPSLLDRGAGKPKLRALIDPLLGQRGRWLAAQNPEWAWAMGAAEGDTDIWHTGDRTARLAYLSKLRETDPLRARELLAGTWKEESPEERAALLSALETGLSLEDEPFLESVLEDKRKEVRRGAASLLGRIPGSALTKRMIGRVQPLLRFIAAEPGKIMKLKKAKPAVLEVNLPAECDKAMQRDGVEPKPPSGMGEKGWWVAQMLGVAPLSIWTQAWACSIEDILAASERSEWKGELFEGWMLAAVAQRDPNWASALLPLALEPDRMARLEALISIVTPQEAERQLLQLFLGGLKRQAEAQSILPWLCRHRWSVPFSRAILEFLRALSATDSNDWPFRNRFGSFGCCLAPEILPEAMTGWRTDSSGWNFWSKGADDFMAVAQFRSEIHRALPS